MHDHAGHRPGSDRAGSSRSPRDSDGTSGYGRPECFLTTDAHGPVGRGRETGWRGVNESSGDRAGHPRRCQLRGLGATVRPRREILIQWLKGWSGAVAAMFGTGRVRIEDEREPLSGDGRGEDADGRPATPPARRKPPRPGRRGAVGSRTTPQTTSRSSAVPISSGWTRGARTGSTSVITSRHSTRSGTDYRPTGSAPSAVRQTAYTFSRQIDDQCGSIAYPTATVASAGILGILIECRDLDRRSGSHRPERLLHDLPDPLGLLRVGHEAIVDRDDPDPLQGTPPYGPVDHDLRLQPEHVVG